MSDCNTARRQHADPCAQELLEQCADLLDKGKPANRPEQEPSASGSTLLEQCAELLDRGKPPTAPQSGSTGDISN